MNDPKSTVSSRPRKFDPVTGWFVLIALLIVVSLVRLFLQPIPGSNPIRESRFLVDINEATVPELMALPNLGQVTAGKIVAYRQQNGPFTEIDQLKRVPGIGPETLRTLRPFLVIASSEDTDDSLAQN